MAKLIILAALGFGVICFSAVAPQWLVPQPCPGETCFVGP
jgi:hypothetical protein